jgi:hypothetical protein
LRHPLGFGREFGYDLAKQGLAPAGLCRDAEVLSLISMTTLLGTLVAIR